MAHSDGLGSPRRPSPTPAKPREAAVDIRPTSQPWEAPHSSSKVEVLISLAFCGPWKFAKADASKIFQIIGNQQSGL
jgi:hypothetical protein